MFPCKGPARKLVWIHLALLFGIWLIPIIAYSDLPETVPIHFNMHGQADSYTAKGSLQFWLLPLVATALGLGGLVLLRYPQVYNYPRKDEVQQLPERLRLPVYRVMQEMLLAVFICVDLALLIGIYGEIRSAGQNQLAFSGILIAVPALAPLALLVYYLPRLSRTIDRQKAQSGPPFIEDQGISTR